MQRVLLIREQDGHSSALREELERSEFKVTQTDTVGGAIREIGIHAYDHVVSECLPDSAHAAMLMNSVSERGADWMVCMPGKRSSQQTVLRAIQLDREHVVFEPLARSECFGPFSNSTRVVSGRSIKEQIETLYHVRTGFYSSDNPMLLLTNAGAVSDINLAAERLLETTHADFVGKSLTGSVGSIAPTLKRAMDSALRSGTIVWVHNVALSGLKVPTTCDIRLRPITDARGTINGVWVWLRDQKFNHDNAVHDQDQCMAKKLVGVSAGIVRTIREVERAAAARESVLITGEAGTSKRIAARMIHTQSERAAHPFVVVDCSVIPEAMFDEVLFGADEKVPQGKLAEAHGGTLVLEDITLLPARTQHKLLDFMRRRDARATAEASSFARIIGTTRRQLVEAVARGHFDEALFEKLRGLEIMIPPLRERTDDIPHLVEHMRGRINERLGLRVQRISSSAMEKLKMYSWPGNVQQLEKVLQEAFANCSGFEVLPEHLPSELQNLAAVGLDLKHGREVAQKRELIDVLNWAGWNKSKAARRLGISRETLYRRMEKYELEDQEGK